MRPSSRSGPKSASPGPWQDFIGGRWLERIDVRDFIQANYTPYWGDAAFLAGPTERTRALWARLSAMFPVERARGIYDVDARIPSSITAHAPGYIDREHELIVGLQTDAPLQARDHAQRRLADGREGPGRLRLQPDPRSRRSSPGTARPTTTASSTPTPPRSWPPAAGMSSPACRTPTGAGGSSATTGGSAVRRGRADRARSGTRRPRWMPRSATDDTSAIARNWPSRSGPWASSRQMAAPTGSTSPARPLPRSEAIQWLYFGYLAAVKEQNGAAMSLGRVSTFLDVYLERDLARGLLTEQRSAGTGRRLRHQAADRPVPAHPRIRRAVLRRPDLGDRVDRRHGRGRSPTGDPHQLPLPADPLQPRPRTGAEPDRAVVPAAAARRSRSSARRSRSTPARSSTSPTS